MKNESIYQLAMYLIVGAMTVLVNISAYWLFTRWGNGSVMGATVAAWIFAVIFAFIGNKWLVFRSRRMTMDVIVREFIAFVSCRLATGVIDIVFMGVGVGVLELPDVEMKTMANLLIIIGNYIASKYFVFKRYQDS